MKERRGVEAYLIVYANRSVEGIFLGFRSKPDAPDGLTKTSNSVFTEKFIVGAEILVCTFGVSWRSMGDDDDEPKLTFRLPQALGAVFPLTF